MQKIKWIGYSLFLFLALTSSGKAEILYPIKKLPAETTLSETKKVTEKWHSSVSQKNLLNLERKTPFGLPVQGSSLLQPKTIRILGLRVEFQEEIPDDPQTTGTGLFDRRDTATFKQQEGHLIDPTPHYKKYFEKHLQALNNFWETVSNGKLTLQYDVFPQAETATFQLSRTMGYYGSQRPDSGLAEFFKDAIKLADTDTSIDFAQYDAFIIFHAGADRQNDLGSLVAPTPSDLFTGFIILADSVLVNANTVVIREGVIAPESPSQDNRVVALNAVLAHEFGHQLGLLDLYSTATFTTQVGDFSLMDNNGVDVPVDFGFQKVAFGVLPVFPEAWSRAFLGFVTPVEILNQNNIKLIAAEMLRTGIQAVKIPINSQEYFLLENRQIDIDKQGYPAVLADETTGVILYPSDLSLQNTREYDFLSPGSGILIWHIDEGVAYLDADGDGIPNFGDNKLQWDKDRRFIRLIEADGIIDFGGNYYTGFGSQEDMYYRPHNRELTPNSFPSSRSNTKADSHIRVTNISFSDTVMTFNVAYDLTFAGWPQKFIPASNTSDMVYADVDGDGVNEIFLASNRFIFAWRKDGSKLIYNRDTLALVGLDGQVSLYPLAIFSEADTFFSGPPSLGDLNNDLIVEVVAGTVDGKIWVWEANDEDADGRADLVFSRKIGNKISFPPVIFDFYPDILSEKEIFVGSEDGRFRILTYGADSLFYGTRPGKIAGVTTADSANEFFWAYQAGSSVTIEKRDFNGDTVVTSVSARNPQFPVSGDLNRDGKKDLVLLSPYKLFVFDHNLTPLPGFPVDFSDSISSPPALGDIDGDGFLEIVFNGENKLWAFNYNGTPATNFPITLTVPQSLGVLSSTPILADIDSDKKVELLFGSPEREVLAYNRDGLLLSGFPLSCGDTVASTGIVLDLNQNGTAELGFAAQDGQVYFFSLPTAFDTGSIFWGMLGENAAHTNSFPSGSLPSVPGPAELLVSNSVYSYPNPAQRQATIRYSLTQAAEVKIKILDLAGNVVDEISTSGQAQTDNEYIWDCSGVASGVYLCRLEADSQNNKKVAFCKIAIVK